MLDPKETQTVVASLIDCWGYPLSQLCHLRLLLLPGNADTHSYPLFFTKDWFEPRNASALRGFLRHLILSMFREQLPRAQREDSISLANAVAAIDDYDTLPASCKYVQLPALHN